MCNSNITLHNIVEFVEQHLNLGSVLYDWFGTCAFLYLYIVLITMLLMDTLIHCWRRRGQERHLEIWQHVWPRFQRWWFPVPNSRRGYMNILYEVKTAKKKKKKTNRATRRKNRRKSM